MTPTNKLRFVEREVPKEPLQTLADAMGSLYASKHTNRVLQQLWEEERLFFGERVIVKTEWRDVPLEEEK